MSGSSRLRIAVLFGGRSVEHEVSIRSARAVIDALEGERFEPIPVGVSHGGRWRIGSAAEQMLQGIPQEGAEPGEFLMVPDPTFHGLAGPAADGRWRTLEVDMVFPLIHGIHGEDGTLQGLLELAELPYVGSGVGGSALGMDKRLQRKLFHGAGLPTLPTAEIQRHRWEDQL